MYAIYLRKSRGDKNISVNELLATHQRALTELAAKAGYNIAKIYREVVSGETIAARPAMQQLLAHVEQGLYKGVLVMEIERLARGNTIDQGIVCQSFMYSGTLIITPAKIYDPLNEFDVEYFEFGLFMSRREYKTINRRLMAGRAASHREGKYVGSVAPYGYSRIKLEGQRGWSLVPNQNSPVVRLIFTLYTVYGLSLNKICSHLSTLAIPSAKGTAWTPSVIGYMLKNEVYIGQICHNKTTTKKLVRHSCVITHRQKNKGYSTYVGVHKPIISNALWQAAQNKKGAIPVTTARSPKNPLAGILICGSCGSKMQRRPAKFTYYTCPNGCGISLAHYNTVLFAVEEYIKQSLPLNLWQQLLPLHINVQAKNSALKAIFSKIVYNKAKGSNSFSLTFYTKNNTPP